MCSGSSSGRRAPTTGDRDELNPGVADRSWSQVSVSARECIGVSRCPFGTDCFAERARDLAGHADVVVTNHALLAIDAIGEANVLPEHDLLVVDEAHELVDRVTGVATAELSATSLGIAQRRAARMVEPELAQRLDGARRDVHVGDLRRPRRSYRRARRRDGELPDGVARRREQGPNARSTPPLTTRRPRPRAPKRSHLWPTSAIPRHGSSARSFPRSPTAPTSCGSNTPKHPGRPPKVARCSASPRCQWQVCCTPACSGVRRPC